MKDAQGGEIQRPRPPELAYNNPKRGWVTMNHEGRVMYHGTELMHAYLVSTYDHRRYADCLVRVVEHLEDRIKDLEAALAAYKEEKQ